MSSRSTTKAARKSHSLHAARAKSSAETVLRPLFRILLAAGLQEAQLLRVCENGVRTLAKQTVSGGLGSMPHVEGLDDVVAYWIHHPSYQSRGKSIVLPMQGKTTTFHSLVKLAAPRASPKMILRGLVLSRAVRITRDRKVELLERHTPARARGAVDIHLFTTMTTDFLRTLEFNLLSNPRPGKGLFQRRAHKLNSDARLAPVFNQYVREQAQLFLESVDEWLIRHQPARKRGLRRRKVRLGVGVYVINEALR